ncbi:FAD-binding oxidoreductase [Streptomyces sp. NPDC050504]|uniref:FAD-binding oxidoreductase n=1 Tax=Streptomyces sp. NPDC050504 TaxID=3365618 RepID=UPI0037B08B42
MSGTSGTSDTSSRTGTAGTRGTSEHADGRTVVLRAGDAGYADELAGFQTGFVQRPDAVFAVTDAEGVRAAVAYAAGRGLPVGVQATGHGLPGASEGGVLISTRRMDAVRVDPATRTARIEAGARWGRVVEAAAEHGLAPLNGSAPSVGAVSYTLGGGLGIMARRFGYTADHARAVEFVAADGRPRRVTPGSDPELWWGLLGGGANLGVVTAIEVGLVEVPRLYGGMLRFDGAEHGEEVVRGYLAWTEGLPDAVSSTLSSLVHPDLPVLPPHLRGRHVVSVHLTFTGSAAEGERLVAPLRALGTVLNDELREMPYTDSHTVHSDPPFPHAYLGDAVALGALDPDAAVRALELTGPGAGSMHVLKINHLGGALSAEPAAPNSVPHREARYSLLVLSPLEGTDAAAVRAVHAEVFAGLAPHVLGRLLNYAFGGGEHGTEGLYGGPEARKRLAGLKSTYDPANLFRRNYNIGPGAGGS